MPPPSEYVALRKGVNELITEIGAFLVDATRGQDGEADASETGRQLIDEQLQRFWHSYSLLRGRNDEVLTVAVLALTKSGKSTLLNALTSTECLPMNNVPETARICKILHTSGSSGSSAEPWLEEPGKDVPPVRGERAIRARLTELNSVVRSHNHAETGDEQVLHIHMPIAALRGYDGSGLPSLAVLDTPGPNEAGEEGLRYQVDRLLDSVDAVVYLLDYTKLKTAEEADMFRRLKQINPQLVKRLSQRLFFVVNKADTAEVSEGMGADDTRAYVAGLVTEQLAGEGFQLQPEQVLLVSARNALLSRLVLSGKASEDVARRFSRLAFGMAPWSRVIPEQEVYSAALSLLNDSGIMDLEAQVLTFLYAHSAGVKLMATLDNVSRLLAEMLNVAVSCRACLRSSVGELQSQASGLRAQLVTTLSHFDDVLQSTESLQSEVTDEIRAHLQSLRVRLFNHIIQTFESADSPASPTAAPSTSHVPRRWQAVRDKFVSMFTSSSSSGAAAAKSRSREELQKLLRDLHEGLMKQIHVEVGEFWSVLEACTNARHAALVRQINSSLTALSRQVEEAVCTGLHITLQPVDITMPTPSAAQFHSDLGDLISKGIIETHEKHLRMGQKQYDERVLRWRHGVCEWGAYWETVPRTRTVVETYDVTMYELRPGQISSYFIDMVDKQIDATSRALSNYVRAFVRSQLDAARTNIEEYSQRYLSAMTSSLETSHKGMEARAAALADVERHMAMLKELQSKTAALQGQAELLVPKLQDAEPYDELSDEELQDGCAAAACSNGDAAAVVPPAVPLACPVSWVPSSGAQRAIPPTPTAAAEAIPAVVVAEAPLEPLPPPAPSAVAAAVAAVALSDDAVAAAPAMGLHGVSGGMEAEAAAVKTEDDKSLASVAEKAFESLASSVVAALASCTVVDSRDARGMVPIPVLPPPVTAVEHGGGEVVEGGVGGEEEAAGCHEEAVECAAAVAAAVSLEAAVVDADDEDEDISGSSGSGIPELISDDDGEDEEDETEEEAGVGASQCLATAAVAVSAGERDGSGSRQTTPDITDDSERDDEACDVDDADEQVAVSLVGHGEAMGGTSRLSSVAVVTPSLSEDSNVGGTSSAAESFMSCGDRPAPVPLAVQPSASSDGAAVQGLVLEAREAAVGATAGGGGATAGMVNVEAGLAGSVVPPAGTAEQYYDALGSHFDYNTGFVRAMSTSGILAAAEEAAAVAADEWTLLDEDGSSTSERDTDLASP